MTATGPTAPGAPTLTSAAAGSNRVSLAWTAPASDGGATITGFKVYRGTVSGGEQLLTTVGRVDTYIDTTAIGGTTYYYAVTAVNTAGESAPSNELFATALRTLLQPYQATRVGSWPEAVAVGDVTGDGRNDIVLTTSYYFDALNDFHVFVFAQKPDGTLASPVSYLTGGSPESVGIGDITGDGRADVVVGLDGQGVQVFPQLVSGALGSPTLTATPDSNKIRLGQFDGDGRLDVAGVGWGTNTVSLLLNDGTGGLKAPVVYSVLARRLRRSRGSRRERRRA